MFDKYVLIRRNIKITKTFNVDEAMQIIKKKYPFAKLITYKYKKDLRHTPKYMLKYRFIDVAFIKDVNKIREVL